MVKMAEQIFLCQNVDLGDCVTAMVIGQDSSVNINFGFQNIQTVTQCSGS